MNKIPEIYAEWIPVLYAFAAGTNDGETIPAMQQGRVYWCQITGARLSRRIYRAFDQRIRRAGRSFAKAQSEGVPLERALDMLKAEWEQIFAAAEISCLPKEAQEKLDYYLQQAAAAMKQSLERSARGAAGGEAELILRRRKSSHK